MRGEFEVSAGIEKGPDLVALLRDPDGHGLEVAGDRDRAHTGGQEIRKCNRHLPVSSVSPMVMAAYHRPETGIDHKEELVTRLSPVVLDGESQRRGRGAHTVDSNFRVALDFQSLERTVGDWRKWLCHVAAP